MSEVYFDNVIGIGKLYLEYTLYEFENEPILFLCSDEERRLYLCICSDIRYIQKWIITECNIDTLKALIKQEIDIASAFFLHQKVVIINMDLQGNESNSETEVSELDELDLPKRGTFVKCNTEEAYNYLWKKQYEMLLEKLKKIINTTTAINKGMGIYNDSVAASTNTFHKELTIKNYANQLNGDALKKNMITKYEYHIFKKEKYTEMLDNFDVEEKNRIDYLNAA